MTTPSPVSLSGSTPPAATAIDVQARQQHLLQLLPAAGALALDYFRRAATLDIEFKTSGQDAASAADRDVEDFLRTHLSLSFPEDGYLGEEHGATPGNSPYRWIIDPIDGTSCFLHGLPDWCISVALAYGDQVVAGAILIPCRDELFHAVAGGPAWRNQERIQVSASASLTHDLIGVGANLRVAPQSVSGFLEALLQAGGMFYRNGSCANMLCQVACGRLAAYYEPHIHPWDCLAGLCIIQAAGGWYSPTAVTRVSPAGSPILAGAPGVRAALEQMIFPNRDSNPETTPDTPA